MNKTIIVKLIILQFFCLIKALSISEVQGQTDISPYEGQLVTVSGYVTAVSPYSFFIQDADGPWNGIYIYDSGSIGPIIGDEIEITGEVIEYYNLTEIDATNTEYTILSSENTVYNSLYISDFNESYESVLVQVSGTCTQLPNEYGEWYLDNFMVNNLLFQYEPILGQEYMISGPLYYTFNEFKINPRDFNDIELLNYYIGDLNQDNTVNVSDIVIIVNYILNIQYELIADLNNDQILNILDILLLINIILECDGDGTDLDNDGICDNNDDCVGEYDCAGDCSGDAIVDECGVCNGGGFDVDQDGICDDIDDCVGEYDCAGDCAGDAIVDECGVCNGSFPFLYEYVGIGECHEGIEGDSEYNFYEVCEGLNTNECAYECSLQSDCLSFWNDDTCCILYNEIATTETLDPLYNWSPCYNYIQESCDCDGNIFDECNICGGNSDPLNCPTTPFEDIISGYYDCESTIYSCPLGNNNCLIVNPVGMIVDYWDLTPWSGPHIIIIEDEFGDRLDLTIWPMVDDITNNPEYSILLEPPYNRFSIQAFGNVFEYDEKKQINICGSENLEIIEEFTTVDVILSVDMHLNENFDINFNTPSIILESIDGENIEWGALDSWFIMSDNNQDLIYEVTIPLLPNHTYGYAINSCYGSDCQDQTLNHGYEFSDNLEECADGEFGNIRYFTTANTNLVLETTCWESCFSCED